MATSITRISINAAAWTQISTVETNVLVNNNVGQPVLVAASAADPGIGSVNFATVRDNCALNLTAQTLATWARLTDTNNSPRLLEVVKT